MDVPGGSDGEESACLLFILVDKVREQALEWASPLKSCSQPCRTGWARCLVPPAVKKIFKKKKKNLSAMQETWVQFLGWEDLLEKG